SDRASTAAADASPSGPRLSAQLSPVPSDRGARRNRGNKSARARFRAGTPDKLVLSFGRLLFRFGLRRLGNRRRFCAAFFRRGRFFSGGGRRGGRVFLCPFLVRITPVIGGVKTGALEDQAGAGAEKTFHFPVPPFRLPAEFFRTFAERLIAHRLINIEIFPALLTCVFISGHGVRAAGGGRSQFSVKKSRIQASTQARSS